MGRIFVSHAVADKALVDPFVDLLITGCNLKQEDIFCSSLQGLGIPDGSNFVKFMHGQLADAKFVIMLVTPAYYESAFCLCELGGTWIAKDDAFPILVPPIGYDDLKAVLHGAQVAKIGDKDALTRLFERLMKAGIASGASLARWEMKRDAFMMRLPELLKQLKGRTSIPEAEHKKLQDKYEEAQKLLGESDAVIAKLKNDFEELAKKKDKKDVEDVRLAGSTEPVAFERLTDDFCKAADEVPDVALDAIYHEFRGDDYVLPPHFGNEILHERAKKAAQEQFVTLDGNVVTSDNGHPLIRAVWEKLDAVNKFMNNVSPAFQEKYERENKSQFSLKNRHFWRSNLNL